MEDLKTFLESLPPRFMKLEEKRLIGRDGRDIGWNSNAISANGMALGGGTAVEREDARRVALAEFAERGLVERIVADESTRRRFWMDEDSSTSGFAAGFERESTRFRALAEAVERWAWVQWIDHARFVPPVVVSPASLSGFASDLFEFFDRVEFRRVKTPVAGGWLTHDLWFHIVLGFKDGGVFPGSRVTTESDDGWTHGAVEAWRNLNNFTILKDHPELRLRDADSWLIDRCLYFGENAAAAMVQIPTTAGSAWPEARIRDLLEYPTGRKDVFLFRSLCVDNVPWSSGPVTRFIY